LHLHVDNSRCQGHARCNATAPEVFALDVDGYVETASGPVPEHLADDARKGARACPERALSISDA
jgi:ferredoxin